MKQKQRGSIHVVLLCVAIVLIGGALTYTLLKNISDKSASTPATNSMSQSAEINNDSQSQTYAEFSDWKVRFPTFTKYTLKRNSGTGNMAAYFISIDSLAKTCTTPDTPWLGIISEYTPSDVVENGPEAGKTYGQVFEGQGATVNGKLYVFKATPQICTRNTPNPAIEQAAEKLKSEIQNLEAY